MPDFLHGVETIASSTVPQAVQETKSAVVGIVGTAPIHHVATADRRINKVTVLLSDVDDARYFGPDIPGYTIPKALAVHRAHGVGIIVVVNVFDPATHKDAVAAADLDITDGKIVLPQSDVTTVVVKVAGGGGSALLEGTDYTIDRVAGEITVVAGGALDGDAAANVAFSHGAPEDVLAADIIGTVTVGGDRTGLQGWLDCLTSFGFNPKILEAPTYSTQLSVVTALSIIAAKLRAIAFCDAPIGTMVSEAIEGRGPEGAINLNVADERVGLCFPHVKAYDRATDADVLVPLGTFAAALTAATDDAEGFWHSPSNQVMKGVTGVEIPLTFAVNDPATEVNQLNAAGLITVANAFGTGYRLWGNRTSAFPGRSDIYTFIPSVRTRDQVSESVEFFMLAYLDKPVGQAVIDAVLESTNAYMRTLAQRGAVPHGSRVEFHKSKNPPEQVAAGHLVWTQVYSPVPPLERGTFEQVTDLSLLANLLPK